MEQLWAIEKDETGLWATKVYGPLRSDEREDLDSWIVDSPRKRTRNEVDAALGEWVRAERERGGGRALLSKYPGSK